LVLLVRLAFRGWSSSASSHEQKEYQSNYHYRQRRSQIKQIEIAGPLHRLREE
jgi:hypothetical protein